MSAQVNIHRYENFPALSKSVVSQCIAMIDQAETSNANSYFALAGGSTPAPIYRELDAQLAKREVSSQSHINFIATDERWVADTDAQSNEGLFKQSMSNSYRQQWDLISLKNNAKTPEVAVEEISARIKQTIPTQFNAVLLGMGTDGHIASLFPNAPVQHENQACIAALHPQSKQTRMSLSLSRLMNTEKLYLIITGEEKLRILESASQTQLPISALIHQANCNIDVFWCP